MDTNIAATPSAQMPLIGRAYSVIGLTAIFPVLAHTQIMLIAYWRHLKKT